MKNKLKVVTCNYVHTIVVLIIVYKERKKARERQREREIGRKGGGRERDSLHVMLSYGV